MAATVCQIVPQPALLAEVQVAEAQAADLVQAGITGCLTMADGVCLTAQAVAADLLQLHLPQQHQPQLRLLQNLLHPQPQQRQQPNPALPHQQVNPYPLLPIPNLIHSILQTSF